MAKSSTTEIVALTLALLAAVLGIGIGIGYLLFQPASSQAASRLDNSQQRVMRLEASIAEKDSHYHDLLVQVTEFKAEIARTQADSQALRDELQQQGSAVASAEQVGRDAQAELAFTQERVRDLEQRLADQDALGASLAALKESITPLEQDRLLLVELRKDTPDTLKEAQAYWKTVKELAVAADPTLGTKVDRVIRFLPTYFAWVDGEYDDTCESIEAFFDTGAVEFGTLSGDLRRDVFLLLINRIDVAAGLINY